MNKKNATRSALFTSVISLLVCVAMLVGTTFAWFTDEVVSGTNSIVAGNLDIDVMYANTPDGTYTSIDKVDDLFVAPAGVTKGLWEPGHTEVAYLKIVNKGTLDLKYQFLVEAINEVTGLSEKNDVIKLSEILKFAATEPSVTAPAAYTRESAQAAAEASDSKLLGYTTGEQTLGAGDEVYVSLVVYMPESVGNEANYRGDAIPTLDFALTAIAAQVEAENDSFGKDYDKQATYPVINVAPAGGANATPIEAGEVEVIVPAGAPQADYTLNVDNKQVATDDAGETTVSFEIKLLKDGEEIAPVAGVKYPVNIYVGENLVLSEVTHNGTPIAYTYNPFTGIVSFETESFSPFTIAYTELPAGESYPVDEELLADAMKNGGEFKLTEDVELTERLEIPEGKKVVLDLNGKTISTTGSNAIYTSGDLTIIGAGTISSVSNYAIRVQKGKLLIDSNDINVTSDFGAVSVFNGAEVTINGGNFANKGYNGYTSHTIYLGGYGTININGGTFKSGYSNGGIDTICGYGWENSANEKAVINLNGGTFYPSELNGSYYFISNYDGSWTEININGGTYHKYDPAKIGGTKLSAGYEAVDNGDGTWTVQPELLVETTDELIAAIKNAPVGEETIIFLADGTYAGDIDITIAALGAQAGDVVIKAAGKNALITGKVTLGYFENRVGATAWNAKVTFEGITFDQARSLDDSILVQNVAGLTLRKCTIIGDGEYGVRAPGNNPTGPSAIIDCDFVNAALQPAGNFATNLVVEKCRFDESCINIQGGNSVTIQNCEFNATLTDANVGESFYLVRTNATPVVINNCEISVDSTVAGVATAQEKWGIFWNRKNLDWTVSDVDITLTDAALAQTELLVTKCTSTGKINATNLTVNGVAQ